jgi:DNA repair ATPase RecN
MSGSTSSKDLIQWRQLEIKTLKLRKEAAANLSESFNTTKELYMEKATFFVQFILEEFDKNGKDALAFYVPNVGEPASSI